MRFVCLLLTALALSSCESALDCIWLDAPVMENREMPAGTLFNPYFASIEVSDDGLFSWTSLEVEGELPPGLDCQGDGDQVYVSGTPTHLGDYSFRVRIRVISSLEDNSCEMETSEEYHISIY